MSYGTITQTPDQLRKALTSQADQVTRTTALLRTAVASKTLNTQTER